MPLGTELRNARLSKQMTPSQVAAATHMKVQIVEDLENEDFSHIAAPIYGKGFIRLYAECVGLEARPLVEEYITRFVARRPGPPETPSPETEREEARSRRVGFIRHGPPDVEEEQEAVDTPPVPVRPSERRRRAEDGRATRVIRTDLFAEPGEEEAEEEPADLFEGAGAAVGEPAAMPPEEDIPLAVMDAVPEFKPDIEPEAIDEEEEETPGAGARILEGLHYGSEVAGEALRKSWETLVEQCERVPRPDLSGSPLKVLSITAAAILVLVFVVSGITQCARSQKPRTATVAPPEPPRELRVALDPEPAYFD